MHALTHAPTLRCLCLALWQVDDEVARTEAGRLYRAGEARMGTDEATFIEIFSTHSFDMLRRIFEFYAKVCLWMALRVLTRVCVCVCVFTCVLK